ncbi:SigB/SigF/SigG family RNA polymerase sigma factor [Catelliglobosispora koreensis]|uniref:SigB/SigF/SigG family RNA polymerase sigma factor n=1 Tax=Catelliglobosispora koreensis TaxID=129052 RepID=UPI00036A308B|nr:SigB/SigF/SigG family RNA polymerase sigma factor [Catelliglobosispora koreensis]
MSASGTGPRRTMTISSATGSDLASADALLVQLAAMRTGDPARALLRTKVIEHFLPMAQRLARRYSGRGEPSADLAQVAALGLIKAVDRYDPARGVPFPAYATPTITGELRRHFRDAAWMIRVPRPIQELNLNLAGTVEYLTHIVGRTVTAEDVARQLGVSRDQVTEAMLAAHAFRPLSYDQTTHSGDSQRIADTLGEEDHGIEMAGWREALRGGLQHLPQRERRIIAMRYFADMSQAHIAAAIGISQMHVSRLLNKALAHLRASITSTAQVP